MRKKDVMALLIALTLMMPIAAAFIQPGEVQTKSPETGWEPYGPRVDEILFKYIATEDARLLAFQKGETQVRGDIIRPGDIEILRDDPKANLTFGTSAHFCWMAFNLRRYPFNMTAFRKALAHLIPRDEIVSQIFAGLTVKKTLYIVQSSYGAWFNPDVDVYEYDPDLAKTILEEADFTYNAGEGKWYDPNGVELRELRFMTPTQEEAPTSFQIGQIIVSGLTQIGLPVVQDPTPFDIILEYIDPGSANFDFFFLCYTSLGTVPPAPYALRPLFHSSTDAPGGDNLWGVHDDELDRMLDKFYFNETIEGAMEWAHKIQERLMNEIVPMSPIYSRPYISAYRNDKVEGLVEEGLKGHYYYWSFLNMHLKGQEFGGTILADLGGKLRTYNPLVETGAYGWRLLRLIYDPLLQITPDLRLMPWLAAMPTIEIVPYNDYDVTKFTFNLVDNATWHDGVHFTSEDVVFTYNLILEKKVPQFYPYIEPIINVTAIDDFTVEMIYNSTDWLSLYNVVQPPILPKHIWSQVSDWYTFDPAFTPHPTVAGLTCLVGTGPFMLKGFVHNEWWRMVWNPNFHRNYPARTMRATELSVPTLATEGDVIDISVKVIGPQDVPVTDAEITVKIIKAGTVVYEETASHIGDGVYKLSVDTDDIGAGDFSVGVVARKAMTGSVYYITAEASALMTVLPEIYRTLTQGFTSLSGNVTALKSTLNSLSAQVQSLVQQIEGLTASLNTAYAIAAVAIVISIVSLGAAFVFKRGA